MNDAHLQDAARAYARAIGRRWDGWHAITVGRDELGAGVIRVAFDPTHAPPLSVADRYQDYVVHLVPTPPPAGR